MFCFVVLHFLIDWILRFYHNTILNVEHSISLSYHLFISPIGIYRTICITNCSEIVGFIIHSSVFHTDPTEALWFGQCTTVYQWTSWVLKWVTDFFIFAMYRLLFTIHNSLQSAACFTLSWANMTRTCWCNLFYSLITCFDLSPF